MFVAGFDILSVLSVILFTWILIETQEDFVDRFNNQTIQMTDFTIRVKNLPHHKYYGDNDEALKAVLMAHFSEVIKDELKLMKERKEFIDADGDGVNDIDDFTNINESARGTLKALDWEVADITFGKSELKTMELLT